MLTIPHIDKLAEVLTGFSTKIAKGDRVLIETWDTPQEMVLALIRAVRRHGGIPFVQLHDTRVTREILRAGVVEQFEAQRDFELPRMKNMQAYIAVRAAHNIFESSDVSADHMRQWMQAYKPVLDWRVGKTKWVILRWPSASMAQQAGMSTEAFEEFFFRVCTLDYARMIPGMHALKALMESTDQVHIQGPGTDLRFSIKGIPALCSGGAHNIPDGEVFTSPVKDSVEGVVTYNAPTVYQGIGFDHVVLKFKAGKIIEATSSDTQRMNQILDEDAGARYIGEFALGFNPHILEPMRDILFDEKIAGSFHFTPGQAYENADNGNRSQVHWDLVCIQRPEYGGGTIHFDGKLIRKDGLFMIPELESLNPDRLLGIH
ncbi:MAG: aminopeptidase [Verrucomicrobia bacterium 21-51-4]|nr:MAG: aminopeptidase [Verrucomicrobia bacterium 21-51-4]HQU08486.1 aminopeptidase [Opitutales bacterium]